MPPQPLTIYLLNELSDVLRSLVKLMNFYAALKTTCQTKILGRDWKKGGEDFLKSHIIVELKMTCPVQSDFTERSIIFLVQAAWPLKSGQDRVRG